MTEERAQPAAKPATIDEYIAGFPPAVQAILERIREIVRAAAPGAQEAMSYQIPTFKLNGNLVHFAAFQHHIGFYPPVKGDAALEKAVAPYAGEKGNLRFPLDRPVPYELIERIVKLRVTQSPPKPSAKRRGSPTLLILLLASAPTAAADRSEAVACAYTARAASESEVVEFEPHPGCAVVNADDTVTFLPAHVARMATDTDGLARVLVAGRWFYVRPSGEHLEVVTYDNGPDEFAQGLVRSLRAGRIGYFDRTLRAVVPATFDWSWPFEGVEGVEGGRALVCRGCELDPPDSDGHRTVSGGLWGYIDPSGKEVVPVTLTQEAARLRGERP